LVLNMLAEATTTEISKENNPKTFKESKIIAKEGGKIAGNTRKEIEKKTTSLISVYGKTVSIIGDYKNIETAKKAIELLIKGMSHKSVYRFLQDNI